MSYNEVLINSVEPIHIFADDSTSPGTGKAGLTILTYRSHPSVSSSEPLAIAPTIVELESLTADPAIKAAVRGWYKVTFLSSHRSTLGEQVISFAATGAIIASRKERIVAVNDQVAAYGANTTTPPSESTIASSVRTELTTELSRIDGTISSRSTQASVDTIDGIVDTILVDTNELQTNQGNWTTATGFSTHSASDVWSVGTRTITGGTITTVSDKTGYSLLQSFPSNFASLGINASGHISRVTLVDTNTDMRGTDNALLASSYTAAPSASTVATSVRSELGVELARIDGAISSRSSQSSVDTIDGIVDTILVDTNELQTNQGNWVTATGFSTHSASDVWAVGTRTITGGTITTVSDKTGYSLLQSFPSNFASLGINASGHISRVTLVDTTSVNTDMRGTDNALLAASYSAAPSVSSIADAVWDEAQSGHVMAGTFGLYLDTIVSGVSIGGISAVDIADAVWETILPGSYTVGMAGYVLGNISDGITVDLTGIALEATSQNILNSITVVNNKLTSPTLNIISPLDIDGTTLSIIQGDDYLTVDGRNILFTGDIEDQWIDLTGSTVIIGVYGTSISKECVVISATGMQQISLELTSTDTDIPQGTYDYDVQATLSNGSIITLFRGKFTCSKSYTN